MIADHLIESIKQEAPLERVLREMYGKKVEDNKTTCDFHNDSSPSLHIFPDGGYKCFVCGAGKRGQTLTLPGGHKIVDAGNSVFNYVMNREQISFPEAVRVIGRLVGVDVPAYRPDPEAEEKKRIITEENRKFREVLLNDADAMNYLAERGIGLPEIDKWRIGMVPWSWANKAYAGRIVFGMAEAGHGDQPSPTIAMAYRVREYADYVNQGWLRDEFERHLKAKFHADGTPRSLNPKYYNDPKSIVYDKGSYLYGLNHAEVALRSMEFDKRYMVVMEGYTDVIMAHKAGLTTSVACCSATVTDKQADEIARRTKRVYLWLDGDEAGKQGMLRSLPKFLQRGCDVLIVQSHGMDPAEVVQSGQDIMAFIATHAKPAVQLLIDQEAQEYDRIASQARMKALSGVLPILESIADPVAKANYRSVVERRLDIRI